jgi:hypothetical protein
MAAHQTSNQKAKSGNRPQSSAPTRRPEQAKDESREGYGIGEMAEQASEFVSRQASNVAECTREHAGAAVVTALVTGFGIGLLVGHAIGMPRRQPKRLIDRVTAEGLGRRLMDRIEGMIPDALAEHFGK